MFSIAGIIAIIWLVLGLINHRILLSARGQKYDSALVMVVVIAIAPVLTGIALFRMVQHFTR